MGRTPTVMDLRLPVTGEWYDHTDSLKLRRKAVYRGNVCFQPSICFIRGLLYNLCHAIHCSNISFHFSTATTHTEGARGCEATGMM